MINIDEYKPTIKTVTLEGYQIVKGQLFSRQLEPYMTIWQNCVSFNLPCYTALNKCEFITVYVNKDEHRIMITPSMSKDSDSVRWVKNPEAPKSDHIECTHFARQLLEDWNLDKDCRYKAKGRLVQCEKKVMLLFDFTDSEAWNGKNMVKENV